MSAGALIDRRQNCQSGTTVSIHNKKFKKGFNDEMKGTTTTTPTNKLTEDANDKDQRTLGTAVKKLLEKKKLSADFTHYELQMIWEAAVDDLKQRLNLTSTGDVEFLQSLCCDLFLYHDDWKGALTMDELLKKEEFWEQKINK